MPRRNGTGPEGLGPMSGRRMGACSETNESSFGYGMGFGRRGGCGGRKRFSGEMPETQVGVQRLTEQKEWLKNRIEEIDKLIEGK